MEMNKKTKFFFVIYAILFFLILVFTTLAIYLGDFTLTLNGEQIESKIKALIILFATYFVSWFFMMIITYFVFKAK